jgi:MEMO1 family protein
MLYNKKNIIILLFIILGVTTLSASEKKIRKLAVLGTFIPADKDILTKQVDEFLNTSFVCHSRVGGNPLKKNINNIIGLIVPHAGYVYSGQIAGYAYQAIKGKKYKTVILLGLSHRFFVNGAACDNSDTWKSPLGEILIDKELQNKIINQSDFCEINEQAFSENIPENSLDTQIPFLQKILKDFSIVPILIGKYSPEICVNLANAIYENIKDRDDILIVVSSDLSHFHDYDSAGKMDNLAIKGICEGDANKFFNKISSEEYEACGSGAITTMLFLAEKFNSNIEFLDYKNSGDVTGDMDRVVGYASFIISKTDKQEQDFLLNKEQEKYALNMARETVTEYLKNGNTKEFKPKEAVWQENCGAFVTYHNKGRLRGCIGYIIGQGPLEKTIKDLSIKSAVQDTRFEQITYDELKDIDIEISVLSLIKKVASADEIVLGKHGVIVKQGYNQGVFLPQVATETGWTKEEFLGQLCSQKAGLAEDAWQTDDVELFVFTAQVFGEKD